jgi:Family of unknown function (DUF6516)
MKAELLFKEKNTLENGSILEVIIWMLPKKTADRPHGLKYRLYYGDNEGNCLVRYDNESGKGDHKHVGNQEFLYRFVDHATLLKDFYDDVQVCLEKQGGNND